jgi:hypothetical protein
MNSESSQWAWECVEYIGAGIVFLGVIGEYVGEFTKWLKGKSRKTRLTKLSTLVLIFGLAIELCGMVKTSQITGTEIARLHLKTAELETAKAGLEKQVSELKIKAPRTIKEEQRDKFIRLTKDFPKAPVRVVVQSEDQETMNFARDLRETLDDAGYSSSSGHIKDIGHKSIEHLGIYGMQPVHNIGDSSRDISVHIWIYATNRFDPIWPGITFRQITNGIMTFYNNADARALPAIINAALANVGVTTTIAIYPSYGFLKPGEWVVLVPQKF